MTKGRAIIFLPLAILVGIVILTGIVLSGSIELNDLHHLSIAQVKSDKPIGEIYGSTTVGQTFTSKYPNLSAIEINMATYARINTHDIIFHLRLAPNSTTDLANITINAAKIANNDFHRFSFPPLIDSENKSYYYFIESRNSVPGNAITIWYCTEDVYKAGSAYTNHEPIEGDLAFRIYHKADISDVMLRFLYRLQEDKLFFIFYFLLLGTTVFLIVKLHFGWGWLKTE